MTRYIFPCFFFKEELLREPKDRVSLEIDEEGTLNLEEEIGDPYNVKDLPKKLGGFTFNDGTYICDKMLYVKDSKTLVIYIHGMVDHISCSQSIPGYFIRNGISVYMYDPRGTGKSRHKDGKSATFISDFRQYSYDLEKIITTRLPCMDFENIYLMGHGYGSQTILCLDIMNGGLRNVSKNIRGMILVGPCTVLALLRNSPFYLKWIVRLVNFFQPRLSIINRTTGRGMSYYIDSGGLLDMNNKGRGAKKRIRKRKKKPSKKKPVEEEEEEEEEEVSGKVSSQLSSDKNAVRTSRAPRTPVERIIQCGSDSSTMERFDNLRESWKMKRKKRIEKNLKMIELELALESLTTEERRELMLEKMKFVQELKDAEKKKDEDEEGEEEEGEEGERDEFGDYDDDEQHKTLGEFVSDFLVSPKEVSSVDFKEGGEKMFERSSMRENDNEGDEGEEEGDYWTLEALEEEEQQEILNKRMDEYYYMLTHANRKKKEEMMEEMMRKRNMTREELEEEIRKTKERIENRKNNKSGDEDSEERRLILNLFRKERNRNFYGDSADEERIRKDEEKRRAMEKEVGPENVNGVLTATLKILPNHQSPLKKKEEEEDEGEIEDEEEKGDQEEEEAEPGRPKNSQDKQPRMPIPAGSDWPDHLKKQFVVKKSRDYGFFEMEKGSDPNNPRQTFFSGFPSNLSSRFLGEMMKEAKYIVGNIKKVITPCLIIGARDDQKVNFSIFSELFNSVGSYERQHLLFDKGGHDLLRNPRVQKEVFERIEAWIHSLEERGKMIEKVMETTTIKPEPKKKESEEDGEMKQNQEDEEDEDDDEEEEEEEGEGEEVTGEAEIEEEGEGEVFRFD